MSFMIEDPCNVSSFIKIKAKTALPILIRRAKIEKKPINYGELGEMIGQIPVDVGRTLGYIRDCICEKKKCPKLNLLVANKDTGVPGGNAVPGRTTRLSKDEYELILKEIFDYDKWDELLE